MRGYSMPSVTLASGRSYSAELGQSLLNAAEGAGLALPHSCRSGRCSKCKCKVIGSSTALQEETGLTDEEKLEGWVLACVRSVSGDVKVEIEDLTDLCLPAARLIPAKIDDLQLMSGNVMRIRLRLPPGAGFDFVAGQYVDITGPRGIRRSYSLGRISDNGALEIHIRRVVGGAMSEYIFDVAKANDLIRIHGPKGTFTLRHSPETDLVFLATGTGIAPVKAMLEELAAQPQSLRPRSVSVYWGGRVPEDLYWDPREVYQDLHYVPTLSRTGKDWDGAHGYVQDAFLASCKDLTSVQVYACGSQDMISSASCAIKSAGLLSSNFFSDAFIASN